MAGEGWRTSWAWLALIAWGCAAGETGAGMGGETGGEAAATEPGGLDEAVAMAALGAPASDAASAAWQDSLQAWRVQREERLRSPEGYLGLSDLVWLQPGANSFGADPANALVLGGDDLPARLGVLRRVDGQVTMELDSALSAEDRGRLVVSRPAGEGSADANPGLTGLGGLLASDATGTPTEVTAGRRTFWVIDRAGQLGIRVRDPQSQVLAEFAGMDWYAPDESWRVRARFEPSATPVPVGVPNILGSAYDDVSPGVLHFDHRGRAYTMHPTGADAAHMSLIFGDTTNGDDTYGGGRFLSVPAPEADGTLWLDFNRAYNPPCAFSPYTTCPLPPPGNRLAVAVEAGERTPPEPERSP